MDNNGAIFVRIGKRWGVGLPWWLAPILGTAWAMWAMLVLTWYILWWTIKGVVWAWKQVLSVYATFTRRTTDQHESAQSLKDE